MAAAVADVAAGACSNGAVGRVGVTAGAGRRGLVSGDGVACAVDVWARVVGDRSDQVGSPVVVSSTPFVCAGVVFGAEAAGLLVSASHAVGRAVEAACEQAPVCCWAVGVCAEGAAVLAGLEVAVQPASGQVCADGGSVPASGRRAFGPAAGGRRPAYAAVGWEGSGEDAVAVVAVASARVAGLGAWAVVRGKAETF